jgi:Pentapeptide repeats (8 copies)
MVKKRQKSLVLAQPASSNTLPDHITEGEKYLAQLRTIVPLSKPGPYPFNDVTLTRDQVVKLLALHQQLMQSVSQANGQQREQNGVNLSGANLREVDLRNLHLERVTLSSANLEGADLREAHLEGADLTNMSFGEVSPAVQTMKLTNLQGVFFDAATKLDRIKLSNGELIGPLLVNVRWGDVNLSVVEWSQVKMLGDEYIAREAEDTDGKEKKRDTQIEEHQTAIKANRQLAVALQSQGFSEDAAFFAYRSQIMQSRLLRFQVLQRLESILSPWILRLWLSRPGKFASSRWWVLVISLVVLLFSSQLVVVIQSPNASSPFSLFQTFLFTVGCPLVVALYVLLFYPMIRLSLLFLLAAFLQLLLLLGVFFLLIFYLSQGSFPVLIGLVMVLVFLAVSQFSLPLISQFFEPELWRYRYSRLLPFIDVQVNFWKMVFSFLLKLLAGYGYKPERSLMWYLVVIFGFATIYSVFGGLSLFPDGLVFSLTSFHGRGFFPGLGATPSLHNPLVVLAACEAVVGLFIEISFIATFTQRYFGK